MKKLFIALGCFAIIIITSSCTEDSPIETKTENKIAPTKIIDPGIGGMATGDDKDPPKL